jgi:glycosyltransferase involved in cell wall biosynthesis
MSGRPAISVVIPTYNGVEFLGDQLNALAGQSVIAGFEVIVADNGSTDGSIALARSFADRLDMRVVDASAQRGQTYARNTGAASARGDALVFLDQDDEVAPGYLQAMSDALASNALVAARMDVRALNPGWISEAREIAQTEGLPSEETPWAYGCTLGIQRAVFDQIGGFDESLFDASEDVDLCRRMYERDVAIQYVPDAVLRYRFPTSLRGLARQGRRYAIAEVALERRRTGRMPSFAPVGWGRSTLGPLRLAVLGHGRGARARGVFLLARRVGTLEGVIRARLALSPYPGRRS